jgi:hypothetical protein
VCTCIVDLLLVFSATVLLSTCHVKLHVVCTLFVGPFSFFAALHRTTPAFLKHTSLLLIVFPFSRPTASIGKSVFALATHFSIHPSTAIFGAILFNHGTLPMVSAVFKHANVLTSGNKRVRAIPVLVVVFPFPCVHRPTRVQFGTLAVLLFVFYFTGVLSSLVGYCGFLRCLLWCVWCIFVVFLVFGTWRCIIIGVHVLGSGCPP